MSDTPFHQTRMGRTFYEHTLPRLVEQLERLNSNLERAENRLQSVNSTERDGVAPICVETKKDDGAASGGGAGTPELADE